MRGWLLAIGIVSCATPLLAQDSSHKHWCFRGRPKSACDAFWLTEFGVAAPVAYNRPVDRVAFVTWELGLMRNRGPRRALGAAVFAQTGDELDSFGIRPRIRFWVSSATSVDLAPGIILFGGYGAPGFSGQASVNFGDYAAFTTHFVALPALSYEALRKPRLAVLAGGRLGSVPGALVGGGSIALILVFFIWCASENCFAD